LHKDAAPHRTNDLDRVEHRHIIRNGATPPRIKINKPTYTKILTSSLRGDVFPETAEQRCWWHKIGNVLNALPKSAQPAAKRALAEIYNAEDRTHARAAARLFAAEFGAKWPKAAAKVTDDLDVLLTFFDYPAEHWNHLRTTNPIESTFATVRLRQRVTKGPGSRAAGVAMAFKLIESAQTRWRCVNAPHLVPLVRAGAKFVNGKLVERHANQDQQQRGRQAA